MPRSEKTEAAIQSCEMLTRYGAPTDVIELLKYIYALETDNRNLHEEVDILRQYGNKECTHMADEVLSELKLDSIH